MKYSPRKKSFKKKIQKKVKQHIYKWHKTLAFVTIIPLLFWCLSGIMHPFMAHFFKPQIAKEVLENSAIDSAQIKIGLREVLLQNKLQEIKNFRFVSFEDNQYYQVKTKQDRVLYFNTLDGKRLQNGDELYANWLSRYFLSDQKSAITAHTVLTEFNSQYKYVNRYLPVHKVSFATQDEMEVYVETTTDKLATFNPKSRQFFIWFFDTFHNWSFIDAISNNAVRIGLMLLLLTVICLSALSGLFIYGLFWKQFKKVKVTDAPSKWRKYHRQTGLLLALFMIMFTFSGGYHATKKWDPIPFEKMVYEPVFKPSELDSDEISSISSVSNFENMSLIRFKDTVYYRCQFDHGNFTDVRYINSVSNKSNKNTDFEYAKFLAGYFDEQVSEKIVSCCEMDANSELNIFKKDSIKEIMLITDFKNREYGFLNKRLPVVKVAFKSNLNKTLFIETNSSHLAAFITDSERREGYSFAIFHKFLFMDWAGKDIRDLTLVLTALCVLAVGFLGLRLLFHKK